MALKFLCLKPILKLSSLTWGSSVLRLSIILLLSIALPAHALTFQTRMEKVAWTVEGDQFECRLSQVVDGYGEASFVRQAGDQPVFQLSAGLGLMRPGPARLSNNPPPWRPGLSASMVGHGMVESGSGRMQLPYQQSAQMLAGLAQGLHPTIERGSISDTAQTVKVVVSSVGYQRAWQEYQKCMAGLLPYNREQIGRTPIGFPSGGTELTADARALLDVVLVYLEADQAIQKIELDGHSDNIGDRLDNRELSRQRVLAVQRYLIDRGADEGLFTLRFHGARYPLAGNNTAAGRATNRRVLLRLNNG